MKIGFKARHGRRRNPVGHKDHRARPRYERSARLLKQRIARAFEPRVEDFDFDERRVASELHPHTGNVLAALKSPRAVLAAEGVNEAS